SVIMLLVFVLFARRVRNHISTLSLHDALPISRARRPDPGRGSPPRAGPSRRPASRESPPSRPGCPPSRPPASRHGAPAPTTCTRSEEHTSELQSRGHLVCPLLLEKKNPTADKL